MQAGGVVAALPCYASPPGNGEFRGLLPFNGKYLNELVGWPQPYPEVQEIVFFFRYLNGPFPVSQTRWLTGCLAGVIRFMDSLLYEKINQWKCSLDLF